MNKLHKIKNINQALLRMEEARKEKIEKEELKKKGWTNMNM